MKQAPIVVMNAIDASASADSIVVDAHDLIAASAMAVVVGSATGSIKMQGSNDIVNPTLQITSPTHWADIPSATIALTAAGTFMIPKTDICYQYIKIVYTRTAGTGTLSVAMKVIGV